MQYDLVLYVDSNSGRYIPIKNFEGSSTLQGIIDFCCNFDDYDEIIQFLYTNGDIPEPIFNGTFKIHSRTSTASKPKVFTKGIFYSSERNFFNQSFLQTYYIENANNQELMEPIINRHFNFFVSRVRQEREHLYYIRYILNATYQYGGIIGEIGLPDLSTSMRKFIVGFTERRNAKGQKVINYPNLMLLAKNAINFSRIQNNYNPDLPSDDFQGKMVQGIQSIKNQILHYQQLLNELAPEDEAYTYYENMIAQLKSELPFTLARRKSDEVTED